MASAGRGHGAPLHKYAVDRVMPIYGGFFSIMYIGKKA